MRAWLAGLLLALSVSAAGAQRLASDFEIATAEKNLQSARTSLQRIVANLNLGDLRAQRMEIDRAHAHFRDAEAAARAAAREARRQSDYEAYSLMTAYRGIALAKLGEDRDTFAAFEESLRFQSDSARVWNYYASSLMVLGHPAKAAAAARSAVLLAEEEGATAQDGAALLDLAIYRYALAGALLEGDPASDEAAALLSDLVALLESSRFDALRRQIARAEGFEVFSFVRNDADAWLSLHNRSLLRLGEVRETAGDLAGARAAFERVLARRSDDAIALAALARLSARDAERDRLFAESFAANPFSASTILEYLEGAPRAPEPDHAVQRAVWLVGNGRIPEAREAVRLLASTYPGNAAVSFLEARIALASGDVEAADAIARRLPPPFETALEAERRRALLQKDAADRAFSVLEGASAVAADGDFLRSLLALLAAPDPAIRGRLDEVTFKSLARMDDPRPGGEGITIFNSGTIGDVAFRFSVPTAFRGEFRGEELRIHYRVTGADGSTLLVEPMGIERP